MASERDQQDRRDDGVSEHVASPIGEDHRFRANPTTMYKWRIGHLGPEINAALRHRWDYRPRMLRVLASVSGKTSEPENACPPIGRLGIVNQHGTIVCGTRRPRLDRRDLLAGIGPARHGVRSSVDDHAVETTILIFQPPAKGDEPAVDDTADLIGAPTVESEIGRGAMDDKVRSIGEIDPWKFGGIVQRKATSSLGDRA